MQSNRRAKVSSLMTVQNDMIDKETEREDSIRAAVNSRSVPLKTKVYQLFRIGSFVTFFCLLTRCLILYPLVSNKFLPGGIHEFLIYSILISNWFEVIVINCFFYKNLNIWKILSLININFFVYKCWLPDDYEYSLILKNHSYVIFIITLSLAYMYYHGTRIFKSNGTKTKTKSILRVASIIVNVIMYLSEFNLLLLSLDDKNIWEKVYLVLYLPILINSLRKNYNKL